MRVVRIVVLLLAVTLLGTPVTAGRSLPSFDALFAFGDSLSDIGNDFIGTTLLGIRPAVPPSVSPNRSYYGGRFSNGPVGVEYLWYHLSGRTPGTAGALRPYLASPSTPSRGGLSLAFGGSGTGLLTNLGDFSVPGLAGQVTLFAAMDRLRNAPSRSLYVVMSGANDYLPISPEGGITGNPYTSVANIIRSVQLLYLTGARHIMVLDLPNLGTVPLFAASPLSGSLSSISDAHNMLLHQQLDRLRLPGLTLYKVRIEEALQLLTTPLEPAIPALAYLAGPDAAVCLFLNPAGCPNLTDSQMAVGAGFFYWDGEHPTSTVHAALGRHMFNELQ